MAQGIPEYNRGAASGSPGTQRITESVPTTYVAPAKDFSGLTDLGKGLQGLADAGTSAYLRKKKEAEEKQDQFDRQQAIRVFSEFQIADQQRQEDFRNNYDDDINKYVENDLNSQDKFYQEFFTSEPITSGAQSHLDTMFQQYRVKTANESGNYQAAAKGAQVKNDVQVASTNFTNNTRMNPNNFISNQHQLDGLLDSLKGQIPLPAIEELRTQYKDQNIFAHLRGIADQSPRSALAEIKAATVEPQLTVTGMIIKGNINLSARPVVHNADGSISTVKSASFNIDGQEVLLPTISPDGKNLTNKEAIDLYMATGQHLGKFKTPEAATKYAKLLHDDQEKRYSETALAIRSLSPTALETLVTGFQREIEAEDRQLQAQRRAEVAGALDSHFLSLAQTNAPVLSRAQVEAVGDPELLKEYDFQTNAGKEFFKVMKGNEGLPLGEQLALVESLKPKSKSLTYAEEDRLYKALQSAVIEQNKAYSEDPVQASMNNNQVRQAFNRSHQEGIKATITSQLSKGYSFGRIRVATKAEVDEQAEKINSLLQQNEFDKAKILMNQLKSEYNVASLPDGRTAWDIFKSQLQNAEGNKVPDDFIMALQYHDIPQGNDIFQAYKIKEEDYKALLGSGVDYEKLESSIDSVYRSYSSVFTRIPNFAGSSQLALERGLLKKYAMRLMTQGASEKNAADRAFKVMYPFDIVNNDKNRLILPAEINKTKINSSIVQQRMSELKSGALIESFLGKGINSLGHSRNELVKLSVKSRTSGGDVRLRYDAASAFESAQKSMKASTSHQEGILVNSGKRSRAEQENLYNRYINDPNHAPEAARPGHSKHEAGTGLDVHNYKDARKFLEANGFVYRPAKNDPWHFEYVGNGYSTVSNLPKRLSTPAERKTYSENLSRKGIWISTPDLRSVVLYSKNDDGSITPVYNGKDELYSFPLINLQKNKIHQAISTESSKYRNQNVYYSKQQQRSSRANEYAKKLSGKKGIISDSETKFILDRGF